MPICLISGGKLTVIAAQAFTLAWTHTVEKTAWEEDWRLLPGESVLQLETARIKGSGAGMEPPDDARLIAGWWQYHPKNRRLRELRIANYGGAAGAWRICVDGTCRQLPSAPEGVAGDDTGADTGASARADESVDEYIIAPCRSAP